MPQKKKDRPVSGTAIAAGGAATAGTGLAAGGIPGAKSDFTAVFRTKPAKGKGVKRAVSHVTGKAPAAKALPGGILGFRTHAHRGGLYDFTERAKEHAKKPAKTASEAYWQGRNAGKIAPEEQIIRHMKGGRKVAGAALVGGAATTAYGMHQAKEEREKVHKAERHTDKYHGALIGGGGAVAGISHGGSKLLHGQGKKWEGRASRSIDDAGKLVPAIAGREGKKLSLKQIHQHKTRRPGEAFPKTMRPVVTDSAIKRDPKLLSGVSPEVAEKAGRLRGAAAQQTHFAEVYGNTAKVVRRGRVPGAIAAAAGVGGLAASRKKPKTKKQPVTKAKRIMSDAEIKRRKRLQGHISQGTGALGLTALGGTLAASRPGRQALRRIPALKGKIKAPPPKDPNRDKIKGAITPVLATSAGIGGLGAFNFAAYTNAESRKRKQPDIVKKSHEVMFAGEEGSAESYIAQLEEFEKAKFPTKSRDIAEGALEQLLDASRQEAKRKKKRRVKKSYPDTTSAFGVVHG